MFMSAEEEVPGIAAEEMATRFRWIGIDMVALRDNENIKMQSVFLNPQNLVIGLSLSGTKSEVLYMLARGCRQGADTILITEKKQKVIRRLLQGSDTGAFLTTFKPRQSDLATVSASHDDRHYLCGLCKP